MRKVIYTTRKKVDGIWTDEEKEGMFHQWGHMQDGENQWPIAIIEREDGIIVTPEASHVKFIEGWKE